MRAGPWLSWVCVVLLAATSVAASPKDIHAPELPSTPRPDIEPIGKGRFRIGKMVLDKTSPTLRVPAKINMQKGIIELVACSSGGKLHESLFLADVEPYNLNLALLLMGLRPKGGVRYQGDATQPKGDQVVIHVERDSKRRRVEDYIWDIPRKAPMQRTGWVFAGSKMVNGQYAAQVTRTLITTYHDPYTILDNPLPTGADDTVYEVNSRVTPPVGTTVTLVIQPLKKPPMKGNREPTTEGEKK